MEAELSVEREKLVTDRMQTESELKSVNEALTNQLTAAKSQVGNIVFFTPAFLISDLSFVC